MRFSLREVVEADAEHAGEELQLCRLLRILAGSSICRDGLAANVRQFAVVADLVDQRRRETFLVADFGVERCAGFAVDYERKYSVRASEALEREYLFIRPAGLGSPGGTDNDLAESSRA